MQGWISIVAASAVLSAGLVAGRAAADSVAAPVAAASPTVGSPTATWSDPPARPAMAEPVKAGHRADARTAPACTAHAWAPLPSGCDARGRPVRVIALTQR